MPSIDGLYPIVNIDKQKNIRETKLWADVSKDQGENELDYCLIMLISF